jgi:hypothetical protein
MWTDTQLRPWPFADAGASDDIQRSTNFFTDALDAVVLGRRGGHDARGYDFECVRRLAAVRVGDVHEGIDTIGKLASGMELDEALALVRRVSWRRARCSFGVSTRVPMSTARSSVVEIRGERIDDPTHAIRSNPMQRVAHEKIRFPRSVLLPTLGILVLGLSACSSPPRKSQSQPVPNVQVRNNVYQFIGTTPAFTYFAGPRFLMSDSVVNGWVMHNFNSAQEVAGQPYLSSLKMFEFDCKRKMLAVRVSETYEALNAQGKRISRMEFNNPLGAARNGSAGAHFMDVLCYTQNVNGNWPIKRR